MKNDRIYLRVSGPQKDAIREAAERSGLTLSGWAVQALLKRAAYEKLKAWHFEDMRRRTGKR